MTLVLESYILAMGLTFAFQSQHYFHVIVIDVLLDVPFLKAMLELSVTVRIQDVSVDNSLKMEGDPCYIPQSRGTGEIKQFETVPQSNMTLTLPQTHVL